MGWGFSIPRLRWVLGTETCCSASERRRFRARVRGRRAGCATWAGAGRQFLPPKASATPRRCQWRLSGRRGRPLCGEARAGGGGGGRQAGTAASRSKPEAAVLAARRCPPNAAGGRRSLAAGPPGAWSTILWWSSTAPYFGPPPRRRAVGAVFFVIAESVQAGRGFRRRRDAAGVAAGARRGARPAHSGEMCAGGALIRAGSS